MIITLFLAIIHAVVVAPLKFADLAFHVTPDAIEESIRWGAQYVAYANGELPLFADPTMTGPVSLFGLFDIFMVSIYFILGWYMFKIVIKIIMIIPYIKLDQFNFDRISIGGRGVHISGKKK